MLRGLIGYLLGMVLGAFTVSSFVMGDSPIFWVVIDILALGLLLFWCHKHHIKKRDEYHDKIRGKSKYRG